MTGHPARARAALAVIAVAALAAAGCTQPARQAAVTGAPGPGAPASPPARTAPGGKVPGGTAPAGTVPARTVPAILLPRPGPAVPLARLGAAGGAAPRQFVALTDRGGVMLGDAAAGRLLGQLLPGALGPMTAQGASVDRDGDVWVTYAKRPAELGHVAGGDPQPHTCANEVIVLRPHGAPRVSAWLRSGDDVILGQAVPSPDGRLVAYTEDGCSAAPNGQFLRVTDLRGGRSWTIGQRLPGCHPFTTPAWSADSAQLVEGYAAANLPYLKMGGVCTGPQTERLLMLDARLPQPGASGKVASPDGNCQVVWAAGLAGGGALVLEQCGRSTDGSKDFAALLAFGADGRPGRRASLGPCTFTRQLAAGDGRHVLISAVVDCTGAGPPAAFRLWSYAGGQRHLLATTRQDLWEWPLAW